MSPTLAGLHCKMHICMSVGLLVAVNFKYAFKYFPKIERPRAVHTMDRSLPNSTPIDDHRTADGPG